MISEGEPTRVYAPGITDPDQFSRLVKAHWLFADDRYMSEAGRRTIVNWLGWLQQAMTYGANACESTDLVLMTDDQINTEYAILEELRTRADLLR